MGCCSVICSVNVHSLVLSLWCFCIALFNSADQAELQGATLVGCVNNGFCPICSSNLCQLVSFGAWFVLAFVKFRGCILGKIDHFVSSFGKYCSRLKS